MVLLRPPIETSRERHETNVWVHGEVVRFYARERAANCGFLDLMDLWLESPYCESCIQNQWFYRGEEPDVVPGLWRDLPADP